MENFICKRMETNFLWTLLLKREAQGKNKSICWVLSLSLSAVTFLTKDLLALRLINSDSCKFASPSGGISNETVQPNSAADFFWQLWKKKKVWSLIEMPVKKLNTSGGTLGYLYSDHIWLMKSWNKAVWTQVILNCFWTRSASLVWKEQGRGKEQVSLQKVLPMPAQPTTICVSKVHISRHFLTNVSLHIFILYMNLCVPRGGLEDCRAHPHLKFITSDKFFLGLISPSCSV